MTAFRELAHYRCELLQARMKARGVFKLEISRRGVALQRDFPREGLATGVEIRLHTGHFGVVCVIAAAFETGMLPISMERSRFFAVGFPPPTSRTFFAMAS